MRVVWERFIPSLLILILSFLAARYLGTIYYFLYRAFAFLFFADLILLFISLGGMRYNQHFSSEHLVRGEEIHYDFYLQQSWFTAATLIRIRFFSFRNPEMTDLVPLEFALKPHEKKKFSYTIRAGTRGIYRVGISRLEMEDFLGFFRFSLPRHERTFYIYPRLYRGEGYPLHQIARGGDNTGRNSTDRGETTFSHLREYRPGMPLRGISWKHFARYGFPLIREYENSVRPGRIIMVDRRSLGEDRPREDGVLETALTLTRRLLDGGERVILDGIAPDRPLEISCEKAFESLYQSTLSLDFDAPRLPEYRHPGEGVILISALPGWELLREPFWQQRENWQLVALLEGMSEKRKAASLQDLEKLRNRGVTITIVERGDLFWQEN
ncbi:MAG: DUF58 domain-containing protein [Spirochaetales bacterium]|nr:DUF58 domain-containing protein [Spirochaetales bacterium]